MLGFFCLIDQFPEPCVYDKSINNSQIYSKYSFPIDL